LHTRPGLVAAHRPRPHFHASDHLFRAIVGPGDSRIGVKSAEVWPGLTQPDEQVTQLVDRSELAGMSPPGSLDLFPQNIQALVALRRQFLYQFLDLRQYPQPLLGQCVSQLLECSSHPASNVELADLVFQVQLPGHHFIHRQIIRHDHTHAHPLYQGLQPALHRLWIMLIHVPNGHRLAFSQVDCHQHRSLLTPPQHISPIQPQHPHRLPLVLPPQLLFLLLGIPPHRHWAQPDP